MPEWRRTLALELAPALIGGPIAIEHLVVAPDRASQGILARLSFGALERRLFLTIVVGLLPVAILAFVALFQSAQRQKRELIATSEGTMRAIVSAIDSEFDSSIASLDALAASPRLARNDFGGFREEARELLARRPTWLNVVLSEPSTQQVMNALLPMDAELPRGIEPASVEATVRSGRPGIGNVTWSPVLKTFAFAARAPVKRHGKVEYILSAIMRPDALQRILREQRVPENGVVGIFDRNYVVAARTLNHETSVGRKASSGLIDLLEEGKESGFATTATLEGVPVYSVFYRSPRSGWSAGIGIPRAALDAPIRRSYIVLALLMLASVFLGVVAALLVSRAITSPMRELKAAAVAMGRGEPPPVPDTELPEVRQVAFALAAAHVERESLLAAEREARGLEREARVLAERTSRMKDEFLAMLGHELRNPLAAISSASLVLERSMGKAPAEGAAGNATAIIRRQVQHLSRLTDDLLDAGRVVLGRIHLDRKPIDLAVVVQNTLDTLRNTHRLVDHTVSTKLTPVWVYADATRIDQIVANLLTNAVKYTPAPGTIDIQLDRQKAVEHDEAVLRIRDSGIGIEPELVPRIFDLFVQGERALDRSLGGLGVGLTLVRRLTELHGGRVGVSSAGTGQGSELTVRLPAIDPPAVNDTAAELARSIAPRTIAIVEDNDDVRATLRLLLEMDGHRVCEARDGPSGVELIASERPDIGLIDIGLPTLDGYGVARAVRARMLTHPLRLIAMTGYGNPEDVQAGLHAGFDAYLVKPVDPARLQDLIADELLASELQG